MRVAVGLVAASLLFRIGLYPYLGSRAVYVLTPCRMDALAAGALLALVLRGSTNARELVRWTRPVMLASVLGLLGIIAIRGGLNAHDRLVQWIGYPLTRLHAPVLWPRRSPARVRITWGGSWEGSSWASWGGTATGCTSTTCCCDRFSRAC